MDDPSPRRSVSHLNIRSLRKNWDLFCLYMKMNSLSPDVIILSEIWIYDIESKFYQLPNYHAFFNCNDTYRSGGIAIFCKENLHPQLRNCCFETADTLKISLDYGNETFSVIGCYRRHEFEISKFTNELNQKLLTTNCNNCLLVGDMNIDILGCSKEINDYIQIMSFHGFESAINTPTRITDNSSTCIDHMFIRCKCLSYISRVEDPHISDHQMIHITIPIKTTPKWKKDEFCKVYNETGFLNLLREINWQCVTNESDPDSAYDKFEKLLTSALEKSKITKRIKRKWLNEKGWQSKQLEKLIKDKYELIKMKRNPEFTSLAKERLKEITKTIYQKIKEEKSQYYEKKFAEATNSKEQWRIINTITGGKKSDQKILLQMDGKNFDDPVEVSNTFNSYFLNAPIEIKSSLDTVLPNHALLSSYKMKVNNKSFFLGPVVELEVSKYLKRLKNNKSPGLDGVKPEYLKSANDIITPALTHIINLSFSHGVFPKALKVTNVVPIYKKGQKTSPSSYRPISIIKACSKVIETIFNDRLKNFFDATKWISDCQFGFQTGKSTEIALVHFSGFLYESQNKGLKVGCLLTDIASAFLTVDHKLLLGAIDRAGVRGVANDWIKSYLKDRSQVVLNRGDFLSVNIGNPQGGTLSPTLFLCYINDICNHKFYGKVTGFADDIALSYACQSYTEMEKQMNDDLQMLNILFCRYSLAINTTKTIYCIFRSCKLETPDPYVVKCHSFKCVNKSSCSCTVIKGVETFKYLGVNFDCNLKWKSHIAEVNKSGRNLLRKFFYLRQVCPPATLKLLYQSLWESKLSYGIALWGGTFPTHQVALKCTQKLLIRALLGKPRRTPSAPLFKKLMLLPLRQLYEYRTMKIFFNRCNQYRHPIAQLAYNIRKGLMYHAPKPKSELFKTNFIYSAPKIYNALPVSLKGENRLSGFFSKLRVYLLNRI